MRATLHIAVALGAFLASAAGVRSLVPWPEELGMRAKLEFFRDHKDEYDVLFVGSSRVLHGIDPAEFDARCAEGGIDVRSFNLGIASLKSYELDHVLRWLIELRPTRLAWVFVEITGWDPTPELGGRRTTRRDVAWHTPRATRDTIDAILASGLSGAEKLEGVEHELHLFALRTVNSGQGPYIAAELLGTELDAEGKQRQRREGGLWWERENLAESSGWLGIRALAEDSDRVDWELFVNRSRREEKSRPTRTSEEWIAGRFPLSALRSQVAAVERRIANLVYITLPTSEGRLFTRPLESLGVLPVSLTYDEPSKFPRLYSFENRGDSTHMNSRGAKILTQLVARDFVRWVHPQGTARGAESDR